MTHAPQRSSPQERVVCSTCGGSGTLRLGDQSFRTCLDCLGQGSLPALAAAETTAAVLGSNRAAREPQLRNAEISAAR